MKFVIIGGGIGGLTMGIFLHKKGADVVVNERALNVPVGGNAFLMHAEGVSILKELSSGFNPKAIPGKFIDQFSLRKPSDEEIKFQKLDPWQCIKRKDIVEFLYTLLPSEKIIHGRVFSHFLYKNEKVIAAVFRNGDIEYGDIFIGADGGNSHVRSAIFGETNFTPIEVKEVVGLMQNKELSARLGNRFTKFQHDKKSISFGVIPSSESEVVWYIQYDPNIMDVEENNPAAMKMFCTELLKDFPDLVQEILEAEDYTSTYIWHTKDFDLLPSFHKNNVVLIGDAAHLALPFTSAGTTNALVDAHTLQSLLMGKEDIETAFQKYHKLRAEHIAKQIQLGRDIKKDFLNPASRNEDEMVIPLITRQERAIKNSKKPKDISILYFTDPICSTCWVIQPQLRKLQLEYGKHVSIEYKMGGLLPSWDNFNRYGITKPSDVATHWEEVCSFYEMPINQNIWLEDPLPSSYPPSIAFKAAQIQDTGKAVLFLRRIREMVFLEKKNIIKKEFLYAAAYDVGLDAARLIRDLEGKAQGMFREDLILADLLKVKVLPTLFFSNREGIQLALNGYQPYESFEEILAQLLPGIKKSKFNTSAAFLFEQFQSMTSKEFSFLRGENEVESRYVLTRLLNENKIAQFESPSGNMWINNFNAAEEKIA
ncbi:MAG: DsbA family protein [bacterium]|jgi:2-polyprenyl-6-methoxyphenol hydroxylase-like FAD-dependent oxidoreductase/predicted DsbA family dithiol-disulfide isomerase|nr:DsbA family protein [Chitinophagaceae bacterium]